MLIKNLFSTFRGYAFLSIAFIVLISPFASGIRYAISWDTVGYYWYLPQYFIYGGKITTLETIEMLRQKYDFCSHIYQFNQEANGLYVSRYTLGQALFQLPFFIMAHLIALLFGLPADGFSIVYLFFQVLGSIFYFLSAIFILKELLNNYVCDKTVAITLLLLFFGTNLLYNYTHQTWYCSTHNYLFAGIVYLIYLLHRYSLKQSAVLARCIGLLGVIIALTRPAASSFLLLLLFPLFYNERIKLDKYFLNLFVGATVPLILQLLHWKINTNEWIYFGYKNPAEGFDYPGKHLIKNLFYFRKGWLVYTPVMTFALFGFYFLYQKSRNLFWSITPYFLINLIVISSWSVWWWSESYGHRAMIESYAVLVFPLAFITQEIINRKYKYVFGFMIVLLCILNIFKLWQYSQNILHPGRITKAYYFATFFNTTKNTALDSLLTIDRTFEGPEKPAFPWRYTQQEVFKLDSLELNGNIPYPLGWKEQFKKLTKKDHFFYKAVFKYTANDTAFKPEFVFYTMHNKQGYKYVGNLLKADSTQVVKKMEFYYLSPEIRNEKDSVGFYFYVDKKGRGIIRDFKLYILNEQ